MKWSCKVCGESTEADDYGYLFSWLEGHQHNGTHRDWCDDPNCEKSK